MKHNLSTRLLRCTEFVHTGDRVADVGCDHGYLGIYLLQTGLASHIYAGDVNEGPLQSAVLNSEKYGVKDRISFYLSDGVCNFPRDFDTMVCAGMGADTMVSILENAPWLKNSAYRLILQCQSKTPYLRKYLSQNGWTIAQESVVRDGRFLYTVMEVLYQATPLLTPGQCYFSPALQQNHEPEANAYYQQVLFRLQRAINGQGESADQEMVQALQELTELRKGL